MMSRDATAEACCSVAHMLTLLLCGIGYFLAPRLVMKWCSLKCTRPHLLSQNDPHALQVSVVFTGPHNFICMHNNHVICGAIKRVSVSGKQTKGRYKFAVAILSVGGILTGNR